MYAATYIKQTAFVAFPTHVCICMYMYVCVCVYIYIYTYIHTYICMYTHLCVCMFPYSCPVLLTFCGCFYRHDEVDDTNARLLVLPLTSVTKISRSWLLPILIMIEGQFQVAQQLSSSKPGGKNRWKPFCGPQLAVGSVTVTVTGEGLFYSAPNNDCEVLCLRAACFPKQWLRGALFTCCVFSVCITMIGY